MDFQSYFFESIKMSSDDVFDELTSKLSTTNPGSWAGLCWNFFEKHPNQIDELVSAEFGRDSKTRLEFLENHIDEVNNRVDWNDASEVFNERLNQIDIELEPYKEEAAVLDNRLRQIKQKWGKELSMQVKFRRAWTAYVYTDLLEKNRIDEKNLIINLSQRIAAESKSSGKRPTQSVVKQALKAAKPNGFHTSFAWSICYANARLIFDGVRSLD